MPYKGKRTGPEYYLYHFLAPSLDQAPAVATTPEDIELPQVITLPLHTIMALRTKSDGNLGSVVNTDTIIVGFMGPSGAGKDNAPCSRAISNSSTSASAH